MSSSSNSKPDESLTNNEILYFKINIRVGLPRTLRLRFIADLSIIDLIDFNAVVVINLGKKN